MLSTGTVGFIDQWLLKTSCELSLAARIGGSAEEQESKVIPETEQKGVGCGVKQLSTTIKPQALMASKQSRCLQKQND